LNYNYQHPKTELSYKVNYVKVTRRTARLIDEAIEAAAKSSACGRSNAVGLTSIFCQGQF